MKEIVLPKIVAAGIYNAQLAIKNRTVSRNRKTTMFEIELPLGAGGTSYIDGDTHPISEHTVICAKPGQIRHTRLPFKCYYIHMIVSEGALFDTLTALPNFIDLKSRKEIKELFVSLCEHDGTGAPEDDIFLQSLILKLVYMLKKSAPAVISRYDPKSNNHEAIERILAYINGNLSAALTLESLANAANFSTVYFHKLFKASTGKTLHEYIEDQRIKKAVNLLLSTDMTLTKIAYECGFSSQSYFSYAFRRRMGQTPREYAKALLNKYYE